MKWHNTSKDSLPKNGQIVLISVDGVNHVAVFDSKKKIFSVENKIITTAFKAEEKLVYWTEYTAPK